MNSVGMALSFVHFVGLTNVVDTWIVDTGASDHMTPFHFLFQISCILDNQSLFIYPMVPPNQFKK